MFRKYVACLAFIMAAALLAAPAARAEGAVDDLVKRIEAMEQDIQELKGELAKAKQDAQAAKQDAQAAKQEAAAARREAQAEETVLLDIRRVASFADYFIIASAVNPRQMRALVETLDKELRQDGVRPRHQEGAADSGWVLLDYGAIIVHLFSPEARAYYGLEDLWREATQVVRIQ